MNKGLPLPWPLSTQKRHETESSQQTGQAEGGATKVRALRRRNANTRVPAFNPVSKRVPAASTVFNVTKFPFKKQKVNSLEKGAEDD